VRARGRKIRRGMGGTFGEEDAVHKQSSKRRKEKKIKRSDLEKGKPRGKIKEGG